MASIKDADYSLPIIHAQNFHSEFDTGTNTPLLIRGIEEHSQQKMDAVVKLMAARRMSGEASARELLAAFIAKEWDISIVEPALIIISSEFINLLKGTDSFKIASKSTGLNVGSVLVTNRRPIAIHEPLSTKQKEKAVRIFCFDAFISNADRTFEKPNMLTNGEGITILDHEAAFSFIFNLIQNEEPWNFNQNDINLLENYCLFNKIKGKTLDEVFLSESLDKLDDEFWNKTQQLIPDEWVTEQFSEIRDYLSSIINHKSQFITSLKQVLA